MTISLDKLGKQASNVMSCAANQNSIDTARLAGAYTAINAGRALCTVANRASLPDATLNEGRFVYIQDEKTIRYSDGTYWQANFASQLNSATNRAIWTWGNGAAGRLGSGATTSRSSPVQLLGKEVIWCDVKSGSCHTIGIKSNGQLWSWGSGANGALGDGTTISKCSPVREASSASNWCQVSGGYAFTAAINSVGQLWMWGRNNVGQLGDGTTVNKSSPVQPASNFLWVSVSAGHSSVGALNRFGSTGLYGGYNLYTWGCNICGVLGQGNTTNRSSPVQVPGGYWVQVHMGCTSAAAIVGQCIATWGDNRVGQLGTGTTVSRCVPTVIMNPTGATYFFVSAISVGQSHMSAIGLFDPGLWSWGCGAFGALGNGATTNRSCAVQEITSSTDWSSLSAGSQQTFAQKTDGSLWAWGTNACGALGDGTTVNKSSPVRESTSSLNWISFSPGKDITSCLNTTAALKTNNTVGIS